MKLSSFNSPLHCTEVCFAGSVRFSQRRCTYWRRLPHFWRFARSDVWMFPAADFIPPSPKKNYCDSNWVLSVAQRLHSTELDTLLPQNYEIAHVSEKNSNLHRAWTEQSGPHPFIRVFFSQVISFVITRGIRAATKHCPCTWACGSFNQLHERSRGKERKINSVTKTFNEKRIAERQCGTHTCLRTSRSRWILEQEQRSAKADCDHGTTSCLRTWGNNPR